MTSATCIAALVRTPMNVGERRRMRPMMRPPGLCCLVETLLVEWRPAMERSTARRVRFSPFRRPGRLARRVGGVNGGACAIAARRRQAPLTPLTRRGRSPAEGAASQNQGFSDHGRGCSWIAPVSCRFRSYKRSLSAVIFGYLDVFCDHKVGKRSTAQWNH